MHSLLYRPKEPRSLFLKILTGVSLSVHRASEDYEVNEDCELGGLFSFNKPINHDPFSKIFQNQVYLSDKYCGDISEYVETLDTMAARYILKYKKINPLRVDNLPPFCLIKRGLGRMDEFHKVRSLILNANSNAFKKYRVTRYIEENQVGYVFVANRCEYHEIIFRHSSLASPFTIDAQTESSLSESLLKLDSILSEMVNEIDKE